VHVDCVGVTLYRAEGAISDLLVVGNALLVVRVAPLCLLGPPWGRRAFQLEQPLERLKVGR